MTGSRGASSRPPALRASKPPFYRNVWVRHPVNPLLPLGREKVERLRQMEPCVVMGRGHSGTRVVAWMCHHLGIEMGVAAGVPSGDPFDGSFKRHMRIVATHSLEARSTEETRYLVRNRFQRAVDGFHRRMDPAGPRWGWKFPESYLTGPYVAETFPHARYLHLLRDGRDVAFKRHLTDVSEHRLARGILRRQGALALPHHLQAALSWSFQVELFESFRQTLSPNQILTIRYEDLVDRPQKTADLVAGFLRVEMTDACRAYLDREVTAAHVGEFRSQDEDEVREVEQLIGPTLRSLGYER